MVKTPYLEMLIIDIVLARGHCDAYDEVEPCYVYTPLMLGTLLSKTRLGLYNAYVFTCMEG